MLPIDDDIDEAAMAEAEAALRELAEQYPAYAAADVDQMAFTLEALRSSGGADAGLVGELHGVAHNIKGQGAAFGYDLMTSLGAMPSHAGQERSRPGRYGQRRCPDRRLPGGAGRAAGRVGRRLRRAAFGQSGARPEGGLTLTCHSRLYSRLPRLSYGQPCLTGAAD